MYPDDDVRVSAYVPDIHVPGMLFTSRRFVEYLYRKRQYLVCNILPKWFKLNTPALAYHDHGGRREVSGRTKVGWPYGHPDKVARLLCGNVVGAHPLPRGILLLVEHLVITRRKQSIATAQTWRHFGHSSCILLYGVAQKNKNKNSRVFPYVSRVFFFSRRKHMLPGSRKEKYTTARVTETYCIFCFFFL